jgi:hypothetical protein
MLSASSHSGSWGNLGSLKADVIAKANTFAESKGKVAIPIASQERMPSFGVNAYFEYQFRLVDKDSPEAAQASLQPAPKVTVQQVNVDKREEVVGGKVEDTPEKKKDIYAELIKLDDLRKRGIITDAEFEAQKKKLLEGN